MNDESRSADLDAERAEYEQWIAAAPARSSISFDQYKRALARNTLARVAVINDPVVSEAMDEMEDLL